MSLQSKPTNGSAISFLLVNVVRHLSQTMFDAWPLEIFNGVQRAIILVGEAA